jgi:ribosomal protein S20
MPISKSAKKALRVSLKKTSQNRHRKALISEALKSVNEKTVNHAISMIDKGVKWNLIHQNKAARLKSRLNKDFKTLPEKGDKTAAKTTKKAAPKAKKTATKGKAKKA